MTTRAQYLAATGTFLISSWLVAPTSVGYCDPLYELPPRVDIVKTEVAPVIDGSLRDAAWRDAAVIGRLMQVEPVEGGTPSERTEIRLMYDEDFLYIGARCFDSDPGGIIAKEMVDDVDMQSDDRINILFDTFHDRRNAFFFQVNPVGTRSDARIENSAVFRREWDGIWQAKASVDAQGWTAEFAIPFKTVSFDPDSTTWGFEVERMLRRRNERIRWSNISQARPIIRVGDIGTIEGMSGMRQGLGLDIQPSISADYSWRRGAVDGDTGLRGKANADIEVEPSLDVFYRMTPSLTASLTFNTDFSEADVDERKTNLTRFSLFFPETRDFFVRDAGIFEFGGLTDNASPFFSRRIGIGPTGEPIDLLAGVKLAGRVGPLNIGLLDVQTDEKGEVNGENLSVGRLALDVLDESRLGFIVTHGDPCPARNEAGNCVASCEDDPEACERRDPDNTLIGSDFRYRNSKVFGNQVLSVDAWAQHTSSSGTGGDEAAFGALIDYPNDVWDFALGFKEIQENFNPALGFTNRTGIREYDAELRYRVRPQNFLRSADSGFAAEYVTDMNDKLESATVIINALTLTSEIGDQLIFGYVLREENLVNDFEISSNVIIPPGEYDFQNPSVHLITTIARPVSVDALVTWGEFYDGNILDTDLIVELRPSPHFFLGLEHLYQDINLPEGNFEIHLSRLRANFNFSPDLSWTNFVQYDNVSDSIGMNSRLRWIVEPGNELVLVWNHGYSVEGGEIRTESTDITTKATWTHRF